MAEVKEIYSCIFLNIVIHTRISYVVYLFSNKSQSEKVYYIIVLKPDHDVDFEKSIPVVETCS